MDISVAQSTLQLVVDFFVLLLIGFLDLLPYILLLFCNFFNSLASLTVSLWTVPCVKIQAELSG